MGADSKFLATAGSGTNTTTAVVVPLDAGSGAARDVARAVAQGRGAITMTSAPLRADDLSCTLRVHEVQPARTRVAQWVTEAAADWGLSLSGGGVGELNKVSVRAKSRAEWRWTESCCRAKVKIKVEVDVA